MWDREVAQSVHLFCCKYAGLHLDPQNPCKKSCVVPMYVIPVVETDRYLKAHRPTSLAYMVRFQPMRVLYLKQKVESNWGQTPYFILWPLHTCYVCAHPHTHIMCTDYTVTALSVVAWIPRYTTSLRSTWRLFSFYWVFENKTCRLSTWWHFLIFLGWHDLPLILFVLFISV